MSESSLFRDAKSMIDLLEYLAKQHEVLGVDNTNFKTEGAKTLLVLHKLCVEIGEKFNDGK